MNNRTAYLIVVDEYCQKHDECVSGWNGRPEKACVLFDICHSKENDKEPYLWSTNNLIRAFKMLNAKIDIYWDDKNKKNKKQVTIN